MSQPIEFSDYELLDHVRLEQFLERIRQRARVSGARNDDRRREERYKWAFTVLVCPWRDDEPVASEARVATVRDVSNHGMGLLLSQPLATPMVVVVMQIDEEDPKQPWFFLGETKHVSRLDDRCWKLGVAVATFAPTIAEKVKVLTPMLCDLQKRKTLPSAK